MGRLNIVVPAVLISIDKILISYTNTRLIGEIAAIAVQNLLLTIVVGMLVFFSWQGLLAELKSIEKGVNRGRMLV